MIEEQPGRLTFVIPCWNEEAGIGATIDVLRRAGDAAQRDGEVSSWDAVLVDDGSTDRTAELLAAASAADPRFQVVTHATNRGLGAAIRSGFAAARGDLVLYTDADLPCDLVHDVPRSLRLRRTYRADVVAAYRRNRDGEGPRRLVYSAAYNALVRSTFGLRLRDVNFAFKLFRTDTVDTSALRSEGSFVDVELLARASAAGLKVIQFGTDYFPRTRGVSTLSSLGTIRTIVREMTQIGRTISTPPGGAGAGAGAGGADGPRRRLLIVNADDYGLTPGISDGILRAATDGVVTSTSVLVLGSGFAASAPRLADVPHLGVGIHLAAVGEDPPLLSAREIPTLVDRRGRLPLSWRRFLPLLQAGRIDPEDVAREFGAQIAAVQEAGLTATHVDTHQHLHLWPAIADVAITVAQRAGIRAIRVPRSSGRGPKSVGIDRLARTLARKAGEAGLEFPTWAVGLDEAGHMHGDRFDDALRLLARRTAAGADAVELSAHPGQGGDAARYRWGYDWDAELRTLSAPETRAKIEAAGFTLASYRDLVTA
jgi:predicted glycoside hydrolase/deacetylase ChbG (UPF0249 family)